ncbi:hypothetical protein HWV62_45352 [Athelia sp. TMB]|nr:hypothetical protein HWV62_45352 [Athelia sp. TMB]
MSYGTLVSTAFRHEDRAGQPFFGLVHDTLDAFRLVLAAEAGLVPRIIERVTQVDRMHMIASGSVIVFSAQESGMRRWRDGLLWTPSRISGNFLVYKELDRLPEAGGSSSACPSTFVKADGLRKKAITVKLKHREYHVIAYYTAGDLRPGRLGGVAARADIMRLEMSASLFDLDGYRVSPEPLFSQSGSLATDTTRPEVEAFAPIDPFADIAPLDEAIFPDDCFLLFPDPVEPHQPHPPLPVAQPHFYPPHPVHWDADVPAEPSHFQPRHTVYPAGADQDSARARLYHTEPTPPSHQPMHHSSFQPYSSDGSPVIRDVWRILR